MPIDLTLKEDPRAIATYESALTSMQGRIIGWSHDVIGQRGKALANWEGGAADAFGAAVSRTTGHMDSFASTVKQHAADVRTFHDSVVAVKGQLAGIKADAQAAGLVVNGEVISLPSAPAPVKVPVGQPVPASVQKTFDDYNKLVTSYNGLATRANEQFHTLYEAHLTFQQACGTVKAPDGLTVGTPPATGADAALDNSKSLKTDVGTARSLGVAGAGAYLGRYAPRGGNGRFVKITEEALKDSPASELSNWVAKQGNADAMSVLRKADGAGKYVKRGGYVLTAASAVIDGAQQWEQDSHDPSLSTSAKVVRATATGVADNAAAFAGGWAGAELGATAGAEVGAMVGGPVGALVGGAVGGVIGGTVGGQAMQAGYDTVKDKVHGVIDTVFRW